MTMGSWDRRRLVPFGRMSSPGILTGSTDTTTTMLTRSGMPPDFRETYLYSIWFVCWKQRQSTVLFIIDIEEGVFDEVVDSLLLLVAEADAVDGGEERVARDGLVPHVLHSHIAGEERDGVLERHLLNDRLEESQNSECGTEEEASSLVEEAVPEPGERVDRETLCEERLEPLEEEEVARHLLRLSLTSLPHPPAGTGTVLDSSRGTARQTPRSTSARSSSA